MNGKGRSTGNAGSFCSRIRQDGERGCNGSGLSGRHQGRWYGGGSMGNRGDNQSLGPAMRP